MKIFELFNNVGQEGGITVDGVRSFLNANKSEDIQFEISTLGGDLATAITIHDLIKTHPKKTVANIVGLTASAGTVIAIACDEVQISDNALFLIHNGWKEMTGNVYDFQKAASDLLKTDAVMVKMYREKSGLADAKIKELMKASDWMTPSEAYELGFVDRVVSSGVKIAASVLITEARGQINNTLLIKLEEKMKNPFKKDAGKADVLNVLALKDGKNLLMNAEVAATGVEVAPLGAATLEDGEYELADGRKIMVTGGTITDVVDPAPAAAVASVDTAAVVAAVMAAIQPTIAEVEEMKKTLASIKSTHIPPKGKGPADSGKAEVKGDVHEKLQAVTEGIRQEIVKSRTA